MKNKFSVKRPTADAVKKFNDLLEARHNADSIAKMRKVLEEKEALMRKWNWSNILFKDEQTGKVGVQDVTGKILVATEFDEVGNLGTFNPESFNSTIAVRDGNKWGFIYADGSGQFACDTIYDHLEWIPFTTLYAAKWGGKADTFGIVSELGIVVVPNILTKIENVTKGVLRIEKDGKVGAVSTSGVVMPIYDSWTIDKHMDVVFMKEKTEGYVSKRTGIFVPKSEFERRDYIGMTDFFVAECD